MDIIEFLKEEVNKPLKDIEITTNKNMEKILNSLKNVKKPKGEKQSKYLK